MGGPSARGKWPAAFGLLLLLLWGTVATDLRLESDPSGQDSVKTQQDATDADRRGTGLLTFLAWWHEWASQAGSAVGGDAREVSKRQEDPPLQQPPRREKKPCKNFFWKTFSSCK
ncbi:cortistatin [Psammomys obesus]|uniref:cortistatin n=1 Tax=Psammomys obesus TaxID=48139 RepID=UPI002452FCBB|nr:cortistatin [Psammomys obesus]